MRARVRIKLVSHDFQGLFITQDPNSNPSSSPPFGAKGIGE